jgi:hypothetical protein
MGTERGKERGGRSERGEKDKEGSVFKLSL